MMRRWLARPKILTPKSSWEMAEDKPILPALGLAVGGADYGMVDSREVMVVFKRGANAKYVQYGSGLDLRIKLALNRFRW